MKSYSDRLPRKRAKNNRFKCQALLSNGERCFKRVVQERYLFSDHETHHDDVYWVCVNVCQIHADKTKRKVTE